MKSTTIDSSDLESLRYWTCGGSPVFQSICDKVEKHLPNGKVYNAYGASEVCGAISVNYPYPRRGSVGCLTNNVQAKILNDDGNRCDVNENGEIFIKVKYPFIEYHSNKAKTIEAFDSDGWYKTGDIGHFDEHGYLYILDRRAFMLDYCGHQISPSEIENVLIEHSDIELVSVDGIPDPICTHLPAALVVKQAHSKLTVEDVHEIIESKFKHLIPANQFLIFF